MGRTVPTFRKALEKEIERWEDFRRSLRKRERRLMNELLNYSRNHVSAGSQVSSPEPFRVMVMGVFLEQQKEIEKLRKKVERLEGKEDV